MGGAALIQSASPASGRPRVDLLGVLFDSISREGTLPYVDQAVQRGQPIWLTFVNVAVLVYMREQPAGKLAVDAADFRLADGMGVVYAAALVGRPLPEMVGGPLLLARLLEHAESMGYSVFLLGSTQEVIERATAAAARRHPRLKIAGYRSGFFKDDEEAAVVRQVRDSGATILVVGTGFPREKVFMHRHKLEFGASVLVDVGGAFTILAGIHKLAPIWIRRLGLEWIYRCAQEPRRLTGRYLRTNTIFGQLLIRELVLTWLSRRAEARP